MVEVFHGAPGSPVSTLHMLPQPDLALHHHGHLELVVIVEGRGTHCLQGSEWPLERGDVFAIPPGLRHGYAHCVGLKLANLLIDAAWADREHAPLSGVPGFHALVNLEPLLRAHHEFQSHLRLSPDELATFTDRVAALERELDREEPGYELAARSHLSLLLLSLTRHYSNESSPHREALLRIESVLRLIDRDLHRPLRLHQLARAGRMSESTLNRHFQTCFAASPTEYVIRRRLERAERLLVETEQPVALVAKSVGVSDPNYFARLFRDRTGLTPTAWRKRGSAESSAR
jgi:AraC-like DNA-binding protein